MSLLDLIAGSNQPNYLDSFRVMRDIRERQTTQETARRAQEVQSGIALEKLKMQQQEFAQKQKGYGLISEALKPKTQTTKKTEQDTAEIPQYIRKPQEQATEVPEVTPAEEQQIAAQQATPPPQPVNEYALRPYLKNVSQLPTAEIGRAKDLTDLADRLAGVPGMKDQAQMFYDLSQKALEHAQGQTKEQRLQAEQIYEVIGNNFKQTSDMEDTGNFESAQKLYSETIQRLQTDPRFKQNQDVQNLLTTFSRYRPGLGHHMYISTMYGQKARDQLQKETPKSSKNYDVVNLLWPGLDRPVAGRFNPVSGGYEYKKDKEWTAAPDNAEVMGRTTITGTAEQIGLTKSDISKINQQIVKDDTTLEAVRNVITGIEKNPQAVGWLGNTKELAAGLTGQFGGTGEDIASMLESNDEIQVRSGVRLLTGLLIPRILNDTSGRYSDADMKRVQEINSALQNITSPRQAIQNLKMVEQVIINGQQSSMKMLRKETPQAPSMSYEEQIKYTAAKHGITVEEVKRRLEQASKAQQ
jgi:hypothetical protein